MVFSSFQIPLKAWWERFSGLWCWGRTLQADENACFVVLAVAQGRFRRAKSFFLSHQQPAQSNIYIHVLGLSVYDFEELEHVI